MVGTLHESQCEQLRGHREDPSGTDADLRVDRPHILAAQPERLVALLRRQRHRARLRERGDAVVRAGPAAGVDPQTLSFDAYLKFIEDDFLGGQRLDPATDGRPDPRPDVRENASILGNLTADFDFTQAPRPPLLLPVNPPTTLTPTVPFHLIK